MKKGLANRAMGGQISFIPQGCPVWFRATEKGSSMKKAMFAALTQDAQLDTLIASPIGQALGLTEKFCAQALADQGRAKAAYRSSGMALWRREACVAKDARAYPALHRWVQLEKAYLAFDAAQAAFNDGR